MGVSYVLTIWHAPSYLRKALPGFALWIFSSLTCLKKPVFYQAGCSALEGTSQAVLGSSGQRKVPASLSLFSKKCKNPSSALRRTRTCVQALLLYSAGHHVPYLCSYLDRRWRMRLITLFPCLPIIP
jgi:hypothetical protein